VLITLSCLSAVIDVIRVLEITTSRIQEEHLFRYNGSAVIE
jgi:hypothetical protein